MRKIRFRCLSVFGSNSFKKIRFFDKNFSQKQSPKKSAEKRRKPQKNEVIAFCSLKSAYKLAYAVVMEFTFAAMLFADNAFIFRAMDLRPFYFFTDPAFRFLFRFCKNPLAVRFRKLRPNRLLKIRTNSVPTVKSVLNTSVRKNRAFDVFHRLLATRTNDLRRHRRLFLGSELLKVLPSEDFFRLFPKLRNNSAENLRVLPLAVAGKYPDNKVAISNGNAGIFFSAFSASRRKTVEKLKKFLSFLFLNFQSFPPAFLLSLRR